MLLRAGLGSLNDIAAISAESLAHRVPHLGGVHVATQITAAAKQALRRKAKELQLDAQAVLSGIQ
jgi:hypothetical protein